MKKTIIVIAGLLLVGCQPPNENGFYNVTEQKEDVFPNVREKWENPIPKGDPDEIQYSYQCHLKNDYSDPKCKKLICMKNGTEYYCWNKQLVKPNIETKKTDYLDSQVGKLGNNIPTIEEMNRKTHCYTEDGWKKNDGVEASC